MKRRVTKLTAFILAIILSLPFTVFTMAQGEQATNDETDIVYELTELRNEFEKHYLMSDGTVVAATYAEPVNYYDKTDGTWKEIDNTLTQVGGRYRNKGHGGFDVSFRGDGSSGDLVEITVDGHTLSWSVSVQNESGVKDTVKAQANATVKQKDTKRTDKFAADKASSGMRYNSPFSGNKIIDVDYSVSQYKVKEDITIYSSKDANVLQYTYNCGSLTAVLNEDNSIYFLDEAGEAVYTVHKPYMYDSAGNGSYEFDIVLRQRGSVCTVVMVPDKAWLDTAVYPVVIDPTTSTSQATSNIIDTYIHQNDTAGEHADDTDLTIGLKNGSIHKALVKFLSFPTFNQPIAEVKYAELNLTLTGGSTAGAFSVYRITQSWDVDTVKYSNCPSATLLTSGVLPLFGNMTLSLDITSYYKNYAGTTNDHGLLIQATDLTYNDFNSFYSSEYAGSVTSRPVLKIIYNTVSETESNDTRASADVLDIVSYPGVQTRISGSITNISTPDYFKITAPRHGRVVVRLTTTSRDVYQVTVEDASGNVITSANASNVEPGSNGQGWYASLVFTTKKTTPLTDYYIKVTGVGGGSTFPSYYVFAKYSDAYAALDWRYPLIPYDSNGSYGNVRVNDPVHARSTTVYHNGVDISAYERTVLYAPTKAVVIIADDNPNQLMGKHITLYTKGVVGGATDPHEGEYYFVITFMHLNSINEELKVGSVVDSNTILGETGNTGYSGGPHLHVEIYLSNATQPTAYAPTGSEDMIINPYEVFYKDIAFSGNPY